MMWPTSHNFWPEKVNKSGFPNAEFDVSNDDAGLDEYVDAASSKSS